MAKLSFCVRVHSQSLPIPTKTETVSTVAPEVIISCSEFVHRSKCFFDVSHKSSERYLSTTVCSSEALSCEFKQLQLTSAGSGNAVKLAELAEEPASGRENYNCQRVAAPDEHLKTDRIMTASDCVSSEL